MSRVTRHLLAAIVLAAPVAAQRTWIVDSANGPGTDFSDIPAAFLVASDGDTIVCRAGDYTGATTGRGITLLGGPGATLNSIFRRTLHVLGLPAGRAFVMKGFSAQYTAANVPVIQITSSLGRIHLEGLTLSSTAQTVYVSQPLGMSLTINGSTLQGSPALKADSGTLDSLAVTGSVLTGNPAGTLGFPAMDVMCLRTTLAFCSMSSPGTAVYFERLPGSQPQQYIDVLGDSSSRYVGYAGFQTYGFTAIRIDPAVQVIAQYPFPNNQNPPSYQRMAALEARGAAPGAVLSTSLYSPVGDLVILVMSRPDYPFTAPPFGTLWFDPTGIYYVAVGIQDATEHWRLQTPISSFATRGLPIALQGLSGPGLDVRLGNPVVVVLN